MAFSQVDWRCVLAPWCRALLGKIAPMNAAQFAASPTRDALQGTTVIVSSERIGCDLELWFVLLEAIELLHVLFELAPRWYWTLLLEACGEDPTELSFPLAWLDRVRPRYNLRFSAHDLLDENDHVQDLVDAMVFGVAEWDRTLMFRSVKNMMRDVLCSTRTRWPTVSVVYEFTFKDSPPAQPSMRIACLDEIKSLGSRIQTYQGPSKMRKWDASVFDVSSFAIDFADSVLQAAERARITSILLVSSISSLKSASWDAQFLTPSPPKDFCWHAVVAPVASRSAETVGLPYTFHAMDLPVIGQVQLFDSISSSQFLRRVVLFDTEEEDWITMVLATFFSANTDSIVSDVELVLSRTTMQGIERAIRLLSSNAAIGFFRTPDHDSTTSEDGDPEQLAVTELSSLTGEGHRVVMHESGPRLSSHRVKHLKISIGSNVEGGTATEELAALVWLVGEPLRKLRLVGCTGRDDPASALTAMQLERVLTACARLERLELHSFTIESLDPLADTSLAGHIESLVIKDCQFQNAFSVPEFFETLYDSAHLLRDLSICDGDDGNFDIVWTAHALLFFNVRIERFVLYGSPGGEVIDYNDTFRGYHGQVIEGVPGEMIPIEMKIAFLSVFPLLSTKPSGTPPLNVDVLTLVFEFAAEPRRRHCVVVPA